MRINSPYHFMHTHTHTQEEKERIMTQKVSYVLEDLKTALIAVSAKQLSVDQLCSVSQSLALIVIADKLDGIESLSVEAVTSLEYMKLNLRGIDNTLEAQGKGK